MVEARRRRGEAPVPVAPSSVTVSSVMLWIDAAVARSYQSLPMMPLTDGVAPLSMVAWPTAVTVG